MENFLLSEEKLDTTKDKLKDLEDDIDMFQDLQSDNDVMNKTYFYFCFKIYTLYLHLLLQKATTVLTF